MKFHILYTDKNSIFHSVNKIYKTFKAVEIWLKKIKAIYWEIGVDDNKLNEILNEISKDIK